MNTALTIGTSAIRQRDGLYSLNDLHKSSGGEKRHQPALFIRLDTTQALISEIHSTDSQTALKTINGGRERGSYACRELVIAYAAWISAAFHLKVIRVFLASTAPQTKPEKKIGRGLKEAISEAVREALPAQLLPTPSALSSRIPVRKIRDLSFFNKSGREGSPCHGSDSFSNWWDYPQHLKDLPWAEGLKVGRGFFAEVAELAEHDEHAAYIMLESVLGIAWNLPAGSLHKNNCIEYGFAQAMAVAMMTGLRAMRNGAPAYAWGM